MGQGAARLRGDEEGKDREGEAPGTGEKRKGDTERSGAGRWRRGTTDQLRGEQGHGQRWQLGAAVGAGEGAIGLGVLGSGEAREYGGPGRPSPPPSSPQLQPA